MKSLRSVYIFLIVVLVSFASCSKDDDKEDSKPLPSRREILAAKPWKISKVNLDGIDISDKPAFAQFMTLRFKFYNYGTYTFALAAGKGNGFWAFDADETKIILDKETSGELLWEVLELKDNSFKIRETRVSEIDSSVTIILYEMIYE